jgi:glycine/sarcosine N-methyltransferase
MSQVPLYDAFSEDYDRFVNWEARLAFELPFFREAFARHSVRRVLDVASGTGQHALAFAREGYETTATDLSVAMIGRAHANAARAGVRIDAKVLGFGELAQHLQGPFDAITCLGNSLPHVLSEGQLAATLRDFYQVLAPEGLLILQNRNFDRVLANQERFMSPEVHSEGEREWIFMRFYDFEGERLRFNVMRLARAADSPWAVQLESTQLRAWRQAALCQMLQETGFDVQGIYGSYRGEPFEPTTSGDLILVAKRSTSSDG